MDPNLSQALAMIKAARWGKVGNARSEPMSRTIRRPQEMVIELYVRGSGRKPTAAEMASRGAQIARAGSGRNITRSSWIIYCGLLTRRFQSIIEVE